MKVDAATSCAAMPSPRMVCSASATITAPASPVSRLPRLVTPYPTTSMRAVDQTPDIRLTRAYPTISPSAAPAYSRLAADWLPPSGPVARNTSATSSTPLKATTAAKLMITTRSPTARHTSRSPRPACRRNEPSSPSSSGVAGMLGNPISRTAESRKLPESINSNPWIPTSGSSTAASTGPSTATPCSPNPSAPFAAGRCSSATSVGTAARDAGWKI